PVKQLERVVDAEFEPVQALGIAAEIRGRLHIVPTRIAVAVPHAPQSLWSLIAPREPFPQLPLRRLAVAVHLVRRAAVVGVLVPQVVGGGGRMVRVMLNERSKKLPRRGPDFGVIEAEAGKSAGAAAAADRAMGGAAVARDIAGMRILPEGPLRRGRNQLGDHDLDPVL